MDRDVPNAPKENVTAERELGGSRGVRSPMGDRNSPHRDAPMLRMAHA